MTCYLYEDAILVSPESCVFVCLWMRAYMSVHVCTYTCVYMHTCVYAYVCVLREDKGRGSKTGMGWIFGLDAHVYGFQRLINEDTISIPE